MVCSACQHPIVPREDKDTYKIECLGRSFHEGCYRCEVRPRRAPTAEGFGTGHGARSSRVVPWPVVFPATGRE